MTSNTTKLEIKIDRDFSTVGKDEFRVGLEFWIVGLKPFYKIFQIGGPVKKTDEGFTVEFDAGKRADNEDDKSAKVAIETEPNWLEGPLFGCEGECEIQAHASAQVMNGSGIRFILPTLRFGEMAKVDSDDGDDDETVSLQVWCTVNGKGTLCR